MLLLKGSAPAAPPPAGAGRSYDATYPGILGVRPANGTVVGVGTTCLTRPAGAGPGLNNTVSQTTIGGSIGASTTWGTGTGYRGRPAVVFRPGTGAAGTGLIQTIDAMCFAPVFGFSVDQNDDSRTDPWGCHRCVAMLSIENQGSYNQGQTGIFWLTSAVAGAYGIDQGSSGFGFSHKADGKISFLRRAGIGGGGGAVTETVVLDADTATLNRWNSYEVRILGARRSSNAILKVLINGVTVLTLDWVADALANPQHANGLHGFVTVLSVRGAGIGGAAAGYGVGNITFASGPTEGSLL